MVKKLTLSAEEEVVAEAKRLAAERKTSVSALFGRFVRTIGKGSGDKKDVGRLTRKATGVIKMRRGSSDRKLLEKALLEKYGL
jgi:Family of unknown function (DUF6364)